MEQHHSEFINVLLFIAIILTTAKFGGWTAKKFNIPAVLGELTAGMILGNLARVGWFPLVQDLPSDPSIQVLAEIGIVLLMFDVGLESTISELTRVGKSAIAVAIVGVIAPFALGVGGMWWFMPDEHMFVYVFLGATLCATSVGISARVITDAGKTDSNEGQTILGAAVIDDVLGLVILALVVGVIEGGTSGLAETGSIILAKAFFYLVVALVFGRLVSNTIFPSAAQLQDQGMLLPLVLTWCFLFAWSADKVGLASIIGAFAAGLILERYHFKPFQQEPNIEDLINPISAMLVPIFFIRMGAMVDFRALFSIEAIGLGLTLSLLAFLGKLVCAFGVFEKDTDRLAVAYGMIPRGEVGLIFAAIGASLTVDGQPLVSDKVYSAIIIMVLLTTLVTPPLLVSRFGSAKKSHSFEEEEGVISLDPSRRSFPVKSNAIACGTPPHED